MKGGAGDGGVPFRVVSGGGAPTPDVEELGDIARSMTRGYYPPDNPAL